MLDWLTKKLDAMHRKVDPAAFGDPLALEVEWSPLRRGGANFPTHKLVEVGPYRLEIRPSASGAVKRTVGIVLLMVILMGAFFGFFVGLSNLGLPFVLFLGGIVLAGAVASFGLGSWVQRSGATCVIDKREGVFRRTPGRINMLGEPEESVPLNQVHALQIVSEWASAGRGSSRGGSHRYKSHELNLVCSDASRVNVVDHSGAGRVRELAERLASFLGVPVWDAPRSLEEGRPDAR